MKRHTKAVGLLASLCMVLPMIAISQTAMADTAKDSTPPLAVSAQLVEAAQKAGKAATHKDKEAQQKALSNANKDVKQVKAEDDPEPSPSPSPQPDPNDDPVAPKAKSPLDFSSFEEDPIDFLMPKAANRFKDSSDNTWTIGAPTPGSNGAGVIPQGLESFYKQQLNWGSCTDFRADYKSPNARCAYGIVPLDYTKPNGPTVAVGLLKFPASDQAHKLGTLFLDPGGPGGSGMELAYYMALYNAYYQKQGIAGNPIFDKFDIVGFDPRGVGSSLPQLRCQPGSAFTAQREGSDNLSGQDLDKIAQYNAQECYKNTARGFNGLSGDKFIPQVGTSNVVRDLDVFRSAVGDAKINYLGFSYGSVIGYTYAKLFPHNIRALTIDGIVNPLENNQELLKSPEFAKYNKLKNSDFAQGESFNQTFRQFLKACLAGTIGRQVPCPFADPAHPVHGKVTEAQVDAAMKSYQELIRKAWGTGYYYNSREPDRPVSFNDLVQGVVESMYSQDEWPDLFFAFSSLKNNKDADGLLRLSDSYYSYDSDSKKYTDFSDASFNTISCVDREYDAASDTVDYSQPNQEQIDYYKAVPFQDPGFNKDGTQRGVQSTHDWCHFYKTHGQRTKGEVIEGLPNTLVVSSTYDPATAFENGPIAAKLLKGTLLIVANKQHCAYGKEGLDCATNLVNEYLLNPDNFTAKVKSGFYKDTKDPRLTGDTDISTKDVYSNVINGTKCQVISFMEEAPKESPAKPESPSKPKTPEQPKKPEQPAKEPKDTAKPESSPKDKLVITNDKVQKAKDTSSASAKHGSKRVRKHVADSKVVSAKAHGRNLANTGSAVDIVVAIMLVSLLGSVVLLKARKEF